MHRPEELLSAEAIAGRVRELGASISNDYAGEELVVVPVLVGSFMFAADLVRTIEVPLSVDFFGVRSYGDESTTSGVVRITHDLARPIADKHVLLVEDIVDTGLTVRFLMDTLRGKGPRSIRLAALLHKPARSRVAVQIDYLGFTIPDVFVVGYGLDAAQRYRNLPYLGVVQEQSG
jgi:hypoxanthine phosphoribosyltransferase